MLTLAVALAAGGGAVARSLTDHAVHRRLGRRLPYGTFVVNTTGALLLGLLTGWSLHHGLDRDVLVVLGAGFAGGYTTLSTWAWESLALAEAGQVRGAVLNVAGTFALGLAAAALGLGLALL